MAHKSEIGLKQVNNRSQCGLKDFRLLGQLRPISDFWRDPLSTRVPVVAVDGDSAVLGQSEVAARHVLLHCSTLLQRRAANQH